MSRRQQLMGRLTPLWPLLILVAITFFFTYPVSFHPAELTIARPFDDQFEHIWYLEWYKHALLDLGVSPLFQPDIFFPEGWNLSFASLPPLFPTLAAPLTAVFGPVVTYNLLLIGSTVAAGFGVYCLLRAMGSSEIGGLFAGIAYAFYPNRQIYMGGFLNLLLASMWLPWMVLGLYQAVNKPERRGQWLALAVIAYALSIGAAWQYLYIATLVWVVLGLFYLMPAIISDRQAWVRPLLRSGLLALVTIVPLLAFGWLNRQRLGTAVAFPLDDLITTSVSIERFLVPSAENPLFWELARQTFPLRNGEDGVVAFGLVVIFLAAAGLLWGGMERKVKVAFAVLGLSGLLLMAGPFLQVNGQVLTISSSAPQAWQSALPEIVHSADSVRLPLPALFIYKWIPSLRTFHHFGRLGMVVILCLGVFSGLGLTALQARVSVRKGLLVGLVALLLLLVEMNQQPRTWITSVKGMTREVDSWLAELEEPVVIMEYPIWYSISAQTLYYTLAHGQKIVHGYSNVSSPRFSEIRPVLDEWPSDKALNLLQELGVDYVLVHIPGGYDDYEVDRLPEVLKSGRVKLVGHFPRTGDIEVQSYWNGRIQPMVDMMQDTYVFALDRE